MGYFLTFFYLLTAVVWLYRSTRAFEALRKNPVVPPHPAPSNPAPLISILLPVKNEEENLEPCLQELLQQDYPAKEIIVINDHSVDRTGEILSRYGRLVPGEIRAVTASDTPHGWTGKNWALAQGVLLARGEWLLFTDADTRHERFSLSSAVAYAGGKTLDLLTLAPKCLAESFWEKVLQPAAMGFLGLWFPLHEVNDPSSPTSFGNGQYLMIRKKAYQKIGGHEKVKGAFLEDFALVREAKGSRLRVGCAMGTRIFGTRMYRSFSGIWCGWRRIFFHAFQKNPLRLLGKSIAVFLFSFPPFFLFPFVTQLAPLKPLILSLILITSWKVHSLVGAPRPYSLLHPLAGLVLAGILSDAAWAAFQKKELKWR